MIIISKSPSETKNIAEEFLKERLVAVGTKNFSSQDFEAQDFRTQNFVSLLVCLEGYLGGGKTTFAQGVAAALGIKEAVTSPTFLIMKKYQAPRGKYNLYHFDCYRIKNAREILDLGWEEIIKDKNNIVLVEWAEKIKRILPKDKVRIKFEFVDENRRKIEII